MPSPEKCAAWTVTVVARDVLHDDWSPLMWREDPGSTQEPTPTAAPRGRPGQGLADQITEDVLQLLYVARQEIADTDTVDPDDPHARLAAQRVHEAITALRKIADQITRDQNPDPRMHAQEANDGVYGGGELPFL